MNCKTCIAVLLAFCMVHIGLAQNQAALDDLYRQAGQREQAHDEAGAVSLYDQAARQGHALSMVRLGYMRQQGIGCLRDPAGALALFSQAAKAGNLDGEFLQAISYAQGLGTPKNPRVAREMLLQPAAAGHQYAQFALAIMLESGEGGAKKETAARRWMDKAAHGPDRDMAARAAAVRDQIDKRILAPDNSAGAFLGLLFFMALAGAALGGGGGGGYSPMPSTAPFPSGGGSSAPAPRPCHLVPQPWFDSTTPNGDKLWHPSPQSSMTCE